MGHVANSIYWTEFVFHRGCSFNVNSILTTGLIARGRGSKEGRQTIFFTPLNPLGENPDDEAPSDGLSIPRKVHYKRTQDAVYWIHLARAQDHGLRFWQTRSNAIFVHNPVPADCIYEVTSQKRTSNVIRETLNISTCAKVSLRSTWHPQQQRPHPEQQDSESGSTCTGKPVRDMQNEDSENKGDTTENSVLTVPRQLEETLHHLLRKRASSTSIFE